jgi:hypothetical protein
MSDRSTSATELGSDLPGRLEALWRQGQHPDLAAFLAANGPVTVTSLLAVLRLDQEQRYQAGEQHRCEEYLAANPLLNDDPEHAVELIYGEFLLRERYCGPTDVEAFLTRFPAHALRLRQQIELHRVLATDSLTSVTGPTEQTGSLPPTRRADFEVIADRSQPSIRGYELVRELGRGGMGVVYEARDLRHQRNVALKVMQWADPATLYRFKREFRALAGLNHPHLVTLYELVAEDGLWFFTMELLDGVDFLSHVRGDAAPDSPLRPERVSRLRTALADLVEGVQALHAAGRLHRDIKPGNVLVTRDGRVVLLDFGLAAELDRSGKYQSVQPALLGTLDYMAPEQASAKPVSPASDWYAVGVILYEVLTGRAPFTSAPQGVLHAKLTQDPPSPSVEAPGLPDDLATLCWEMVRREPAARPSGEDILRRLRSGVAIPETPATPVAAEALLVGRQPHLAALAEAFAESRAGQVVVAAIHGCSGAGKSALLRCFLDRVAESGEAVVLSGRCYEQESVPYKALDSLIDALSRYLEGLPRLEAEALLPRDILALARAFPVLRRIRAVAGAPRRGGEACEPQEVRRRALAALRELLARIGDRRPLILAIDDLQWGDIDSAALLADLLAPPDPPALLLIGCYRREDAEISPSLAAFARLAKEVRWHEVAVEPLDSDELHDLIRSLLGGKGEEQAKTIARQSGGYPFFVHELVRHLQEGSALSGSTGDLTLASVLGKRVGRLSAEAQRLLEVVAVAGRPVSQEVAFQAAGIAGDGPRALAGLRSARLLRSAGSADQGSIETYHDRVRETIVASLSPERQSQDHRRLAEALEKAGDCDPEVLAVHWQGAGEAARAGAHAMTAAEQASEALAFDRAAQLYRLALALLQPAGDDARRLRTRLGDALAGAGRGAEAAEQYLTAAVGAGPDESLELQRRAAQHLLSSGHIDAGLSALRAVLGAVGLRLASTPRRAFWSLVWERLRLRLRGLSFRLRPVDSIPPAELRKLDVCQSAASGLSIVETIQGALFQSRSLRLALRAGESGRLITALALEAAHESIGGTRSRPRTDALLQTAEALAQNDPRPYPRAVVRLCQGVAAALEGDWPRGRQLCDEAEELLRNTGTGAAWELGTAQRFALWPLMFLGEIKEIARRLPGLFKETRERDDLYGETNLSLVIRTFLRLAADEPQRARSELAEIMQRWSHEGFHVQHMNRLLDETQIDLYEGHGSSAYARLIEHWARLERSHLLRVQQVRVFMQHLRGRSALAAAAQGKDREQLLQSADRDARALTREGAPWAEALALLLSAGVALGRGDRIGALKLLQDGSRRCEATGMRLFAVASNRQRGLLMTGDEGRTLVESADAWMRSEQIVRPERMADLLVPLATGASKWG